MSAQIFATGSFEQGDLTWGWQCSRCRAEESGFGTASRAAQERHDHIAMGCEAKP